MGCYNLRDGALLTYLSKLNTLTRRFGIEYAVIEGVGVQVRIADIFQTQFKKLGEPDKLPRFVIDAYLRKAENVDVVYSGGNIDDLLLQFIAEEIKLKARDQKSNYKGLSEEELYKIIETSSYISINSFSINSKEMHTKIRVASPEHLVALKLISGEDHDKSDIDKLLSLIKTANTPFDFKEVEQILKRNRKGDLLRFLERKFKTLERF